MKMSNEDKILVGAGVAGVGVLGFLYWKKKKKQNETQNLLLSNSQSESTEPVPKPNPKPTQGATLDKNKLLKKGSKGIEVRELQRLLGVSIDGDFGNETLTALQNKKGVSSISINAYHKKIIAPRANPTAKVLPKAGARLMAIKNDVSLFNAKRNANGTYINSGSKPFFGSSFDYGDHIGNYVSVKSDGEYLIKREGVYYFVNGDFVKPY